MKDSVEATNSLDDSSKGSVRLDWLDLTRLLCAFMILGVHWLRACYELRLFGVGEAHVLIENYQGQDIGLSMLPHVFIERPINLAAWLADVVGILGGFGWEAVSALIIVSGFSLTMSIKARRFRASQWIVWIRKRANRILVPFYLVAIPFISLFFILLVLLPRFHQTFFVAILAKLHVQFHTPILGILMSHIVLFDPYKPQGIASFFAPAWWFVPAILLAYLSYPILIGFVRKNSALSLITAGIVSIVSYRLADTGVLYNENWYYIVLQESFNFTLGIAFGHAWTTGGRIAFERAMQRRSMFLIGVGAFLVGNVANWSPFTRPIASMLFGPGLLLILIAIAIRLKGRTAAVARKLDSYDLYLVHQPFAYPIALGAKLIFHSYAIFFGMFGFYFATAIAAMMLSALQSRIKKRSIG